MATSAQKFANQAGKVVWNINPFMKELEDAIQRSLDGIGAHIEKQARFNVPVDTGLLYSTISYYRSKYKSPTGVGSIVYAGNKGKGWLKSRHRSGKKSKAKKDTAYYAFMVEVGHRVYRRYWKAGPTAYLAKMSNIRSRRVSATRQGLWTMRYVPGKRYLGDALRAWSPRLVPEMQRLGMKVVGGRL